MVNDITNFDEVRSLLKTTMFLNEFKKSSGIRQKKIMDDEFYTVVIETDYILNSDSTDVGVCTLNIISKPRSGRFEQMVAQSVYNNKLRLHKKYKARVFNDCVILFLSEKNDNVFKFGANITSFKTNEEALVPVQLDKVHMNEVQFMYDLSHPKYRDEFWVSCLYNTHSNIFNDTEIHLSTSLKYNGLPFNELDYNKIWNAIELTFGLDDNKVLRCNSIDW